LVGFIDPIGWIGLRIDQSIGGISRSRKALVNSESRNKNVPPMEPVNKFRDRRDLQIPRLFVFSLFSFFFCVTTAFAQQIEMSSSLNPVGSGARATGMGGAFIGVADDATAASWNPAGLIQLEKPEVSAVYSYFKRKQGYSSSSHPEIESINTMDTSGLNYASAVLPFVFAKRNVVLSVNYQRLYEMNKNVAFRYTWDIGGDKLRDNVRFAQDGYLYTASPALAVQITPELSLGVTLNVWDNYLGSNGWESAYASSASGTLAGNPVTIKNNEKSKTAFTGTNAHLGFLWTPFGRFTVGGVYKTPFDGRLKKRSTATQVQDWPTIPLHIESTASRVEHLTMRMPASYGLGFAYRHSDRWTVSLDVYKTEWSRFSVEDGLGNDVNPFDGKPLSEGRLKDTTQVRIGTEYLIIRGRNVIPLRFGLFYDPEPTKGNPDDYYGFSVGMGFVRGKIAIDAAYQYRSGKNVSGDIAAIEGSKADITQHTGMMSVIYYF
jgi:long-subunit fatty acid transport protein